jgi:hypothetical protein
MRSGNHQKLLFELGSARLQCGRLTFFDRYQACCASETGDLQLAEALFNKLDVDGDAELAIAYLRHLIRKKEFGEAATFAESLASQGSMSAWSYLTLLWRQTEDSRLDWLEDLENSVSVIDLEINPQTLNRMAAVVRDCHRSVRHPYDQSMRGGTQTDGNLLIRTDPQLKALKDILQKNIDGYVSSLKAGDDTHPFYRFAGKRAHMFASYSVLLQGSGYHQSHMHPNTWISCCFYLDTPSSIGADLSNPEGWFALGCAPDNLNLEASASKLVRPEPGRLVIFPSFLWHGTVPFSSGQRLSVVCDLVVRE